MKLTIDPKTLAEAVTWAARTLPNRPTAPILAGLHLQADADGTLTISAFDYDTAARATIQADTVPEPGQTVIPGRILAEVTASLASSRSIADIAANGNEATITCGTADFTLQTLPVDDYPALPQPPEPAGTVDGALFAAAVNQIHVACSRDTTLPMLNGIRVDSDGPTLTLAATDRYRIAVRDLPWTPETGQTLGVLVPGKTLHAIAKTVGGQPVTVAFTDSLAAISTPGRQTIVRLLEPQFIDYRARIRIDPAITATVDPQALAAAVKRVALVADPDAAAIRLAFTDGHVRVQAGDGNIGRGGDTVACQLDGDPIDIAFQAAFLLDGLQAIDGPMTIGMETPTRPALLSSQDGAFQYLAMSLRLS
ncbi:MAG TPA: DNA polymerase III subunit beta [Sporichthya sp.]|nr:DNA polymerase III subunit beta [Sporichthya sp.]